MDRSGGVMDAGTLLKVVGQPGHSGIHHVTGDPRRWRRWRSGKSLKNHQAEVAPETLLP